MFVFRKAHVAQLPINKREDDVLAKLNAFLDKESPRLAQILYRVLQDQQGAITYKELREAVMRGLEKEILEWRDDYVRMVERDLKPAWLAAMKAGAAEWERKLGGKLLDDRDRDVKAWLDQKGAAFVTNISEETRRAVQAILWHGQAENWTAARLARYIRPCVGQTMQDAKANARYQQSVYDTLREKHPRMTEEAAAKKAQEAALKYAERQHRRRADMIANTELAFAYNRGAHEGVRSAMRQGLMGACVKVWTTAGSERVCSRCAGLNGKTIGFDESFDIKGKELFAGMHETPPAHPRCRCAVQYREIGAAGQNSPSTSGNSLNGGGGNGIIKPQAQPLTLTEQQIRTTVESLRTRLDGYQQSYDALQRQIWATKDPALQNVLRAQEAKLLQEWRDVETAFDLARVDAAKKKVMFASELGKTLDKADVDALLKAVKAAPEDARVVWNRYEGKMKVGNTNVVGMQHYHPNTHDIHIRISDNRRPMSHGNPPYTTTFHELGHLIDHASAKYIFNYSQVPRYDFYNVLKSEVDEYVKTTLARLKAEAVKQGVNPKTIKKADAYAEVQRELCRLPMSETRAVSDVFSGATLNKVKDGWIHEAKYWKDRGQEQICKEFFAEMYSSTIVNPQAIVAARRFIPKSCDLFEKILNDIANGVRA